MRIQEINTATAITKAFTDISASVRTGIIYRAGLLAMQGRYPEAENTMRHLLKDADPNVTKKIKDAINDIKPVKINDKIADTSALEKSKAHVDWINNTFVPWTEKLLGSGVNEDCWTGYRQVGMKKKGKRMVPNCVPVNEDLDYCLHCGNLMIPEAYQGGLRKWFKQKWVNIAKKEGGKHPECGSSGKDKGYAKCVPASKARSMSKKEKESATRRKRAAQNKAGRGGKDRPGSGKAPIRVSTESQIDEKWSTKYKRSIDCDNPKGFSQRAHCAGRKK